MRTKARWTNVEPWNASPGGLVHTLFLLLPLVLVSISDHVDRYSFRTCPFWAGMRVTGQHPSRSTADRIQSWQKTYPDTVSAAGLLRRPQHRGHDRLSDGSPTPWGCGRAGGGGGAGGRVRARITPGSCSSPVANHHSASLNPNTPAMRAVRTHVAVVASTEVASRRRVERRDVGEVEVEIGSP